MAVGQACRSLRRLSGFLFLLVLFSRFKQHSVESTSTLLYVGTRLSATPLVEGGRTLFSVFVRPSNDGDVLFQRYSSFASSLVLLFASST